MNWTGSTGQWWLAAFAAVAFALGLTLSAGCSDEEEDQNANVDTPTPCETDQDCADDEMCEDDECVDLPTPCEADQDCADDEMCEEVGCVEAECLEEDEEEDSEEMSCGEAEMCENRRCVRDPAVIVDEDYFVSFTSRTIAGPTDSSFHVLANRDEIYAEIDVDGFECGQVRACALTESMEYFIVLDHAEDLGLFDAYFAPFDEENLAIAGDFEVFAEGVRNPRIRGEGIIYDVDSTSGHYRTVEGDDQEVLPLSERDDGWDFHPATETVVYFWPAALDSLDVYVNTVGDEPFLREGPSVAFLSGSNRPGTAGGFFLGVHPTGFSDDGRFVAFNTYGPNNYGYCTSDDDCDGIAHVCGEDEQPRCVAMEETVHVIDLEYRDEIHQACTSHDDCGPVNRCDSGSPDFQGGVCAPQRIVLGPSDVTQQQKTACEWTREEGTFTHAHSPLSFGPDELLYFVGYRDCVRSAQDAGSEVESDIPRTSIVAADPETGEFEEIYGNIDREDYSACANDPAGPDCNMVIERAQLSPEGNDIVFLGTVPTIGSPGQAHNALEVWRIQRDGEDPEPLGGMSQVETAYDVNVHAIAEEDDDDEDEDDDGEDDDGEDDDGEDDDGEDDDESGE